MRALQASRFMAAILLGATAVVPSGVGAADIGAGRAAFVRQCALCHTVARDGPNRFGPNLFDTLDRPAGSAPGFNYSPAFKSTATWIWTPETVASFISAPAQMVPGTRMGMFQGVSDRDRDNIVAYLQSQK